MKPTNAVGLFAATLLASICGCSSMRDVPETKVRLQDTPTPVRHTIERELTDGQLEDIAMEKRDGKFVYETDLIRDGQKWEVIVNREGSVISRKKEGATADEAVPERKAALGWQETFPVKKADLRPTGNNPFLAMQPGRVLNLGHGDERLTIKILPDTKVVDGVTTGVLEEREEKGGQLVEVSHNYFATDPLTGDVYYFGEEVDNYKGGQVINHDSAWLAGVNRARFGLMIPGKPAKGQKFYQEIAPKVALDRVEIVSTNETVKTPAGTFRHCVHLRETTPLEQGISHKFYAPGIGLVKDDQFELLQKP